MTRAEVTAVSIFQAYLPVPGRVIPTDRIIEQAVHLGERRFEEIGCRGRSHRPCDPTASLG